jgi:hypothetical protein
MPVHLTPPSWPLQRWGMNLVGPLPVAQGNCKFAVVAVDYFTKWVEAKALGNITTRTIQKFFWQNIVCRFRVPKELTVDNGETIRLLFHQRIFQNFGYSREVFVSISSAV